jgi:hypothetical protein
MKLAENEERALERLREELFARYPIIDFPSMARRQEERKDRILIWM